MELALLKDKGRPQGQLDQSQDSLELSIYSLGVHGIPQPSNREKKPIPCRRTVIPDGMIFPDPRAQNKTLRNSVLCEQEGARGREEE